MHICSYLIHLYVYYANLFYTRIGTRMTLCEYRDVCSVVCGAVANRGIANILIKCVQQYRHVSCSFLFASHWPHTDRQRLFKKLTHAKACILVDEWNTVSCAAPGRRVLIFVGEKAADAKG